MDFITAKIKKKLAIIITHPIQYYSPLFKLLSERNKIKIKVFYTWEQSKKPVYDKKFGKKIKWDIPLLADYNYTFIKNTSKKPGSGTFNGVKNPSLNKEIITWGADAILVFGWNHQSHFKAMRYFKGKIPVYFRGDSTLLDEQPGIKIILRRLWLTFVYSFVDKALFVGTNNKHYFLKHGLKEDQLFFAPHAVDNNRFFDTSGEYKKTADKWRTELGLSKNDVVFLFVGKFEKKKNPLLLINAANFFPEFKFIFVGNGELETEMKQKASKNVYFLRFQNQSKMPIVYRLADVFILPSQGPGETWGLAVNEAMACGKPIIVSDKVGCAVDLVENNKNGYIIKSDNIQDLSLKLKLICSNITEFSMCSEEKIKSWNFDKIALVLESLVK